MTAGGLQDGDYMLGEFPVIGCKWYYVSNLLGNLAGSILSLRMVWKMLLNGSITNPHEAVMIFKWTPAKSVHIDDVCGQIREGYDANFIVLNGIWN